MHQRTIEDIIREIVEDAIAMKQPIEMEDIAGVIGALSQQIADLRWELANARKGDRRV